MLVMHEAAQSGVDVAIEMEELDWRIILFSMGCTVLYGIIHAQVAAHVCVEYFTVDHFSL